MTRDKTLEPPFNKEFEDTYDLGYRHGKMIGACDILIWICFGIAICAFIGVGSAVLVAHWSDILGWSINNG